MNKSIIVRFKPYYSFLYIFEIAVNIFNLYISYIFAFVF